MYNGGSCYGPQERYVVPTADAQAFGGSESNYNTAFTP